MRGFVAPSLVLFLLSFNKAHSHSFVCDTLMSSPSEINAYGESGLDETDHFIVYLESLLEKGIMEDDHLSYLISGLEEGRIINPFHDEGGVAAEIQGKGVQGFIDRGALDRHRLSEWARKRAKEKERIRVKRSETRSETQNPFQKIVFHPVSVGSFKMGQEGKKVDVDLTYPIEVMSTQVTQMHWVEIMGENPSHFVKGDGSFVINRDGKSIPIQPNHPVENITWWSALVFANRLSEKHGLIPIYDLSEITWEFGTKAENGTLRGNGEIKIQTIDGVYPQHLGAFYRAEGYRLPTEAEQEFLLRAGGAAIGRYRYHFGNDHDELRDYAWYQLNSRDKTHPVAERKPLILDGKEFYDLHGNVWEWAWDGYHRRLEGGLNPIGLLNGGEVGVMRGGSFREHEDISSSSARAIRIIRTRTIDGGFRLVRTIGGEAVSDEK